MKHAHGLVIGKFYPPHAGHLHVIETAAASCDRVTVVVMAGSWELIPLERRIGWLREAFPRGGDVLVVGEPDDVRVDYDDPAIWDAHCRVIDRGIARAIAEAGLPPEAAKVDAVFTSEPYGAELARRCGDAHHFSVDPARLLKPVSGTLARTDPASVWTLIPPAVRAYMARRVVVVGAESSGTTTLTMALAARYAARRGVWSETRWVPEVGRGVSEARLAALGPGAKMTDVAWQTTDFVSIAYRQLADLESAARIGGPVLFGDTDALATGIWHERYMEKRSPAVEALAAAAPPDLYILTDDVGVPFEQDGLRDGEHRRAWMTARFREVLAPLNHLEVRGTPDERLATAIAAVDAMLATPALPRPFEPHVLPNPV